MNRRPSITWLLISHAIFAPVTILNRRLEAWRAVRRTGVPILIAILLAGCGGAGRSVAISTSFTPYSAGVLRIAMQDPTQALDPQFLTDATDLELFRCCLLRTLYSYRPGSTSGPLLVPDLASGAPSVSRDRRTWTFHLRSGVRYAPPYEHLDVTSMDIRRALMQLAYVEGPGDALQPYFGVIRGFRAYASRRAATISGLATPDAHTLVVSLSQPAGDFAYRFSLPTTAPIPPSLRDPALPLGAAQGHEFEWGRFIVSTGPYMFLDANKVNPRQDPSEQPAPKGFEPGISIVLVPNPSWDPRTDPLRRPLPRRIEIRLNNPSVPPSSDWPLLRAGKLDLVLDANPPSVIPGTIVHRTQSDQILYASMNLAQPPFNDIHVRRAVELALNRQALAHSFASTGAPSTATTHFAPDGVEGGLLDTGINTPAASPNISQARAEMSMSAYDPDHDGICDASACRAVREVDAWGASASTLSVFNHALDRLGINAKLDPLGIPFSEPVYQNIGAITFPIQQGPLYPDASTLFVPIFSGHSLVTSYFDGPETGAGNFNTSLLGATPSDLRRLRYYVRSVPSADNRIRQCLSLVGTLETECWAYLDSYVTQELAAVAPIATPTNIRAVSKRISNYRIDPLTALPALEELDPHGSAPVTPGLARAQRSCPASPVPEGIYAKTITLPEMRSAAVPGFVRKFLGVAPVFDTFPPGQWIWRIRAPDANCIFEASYIHTQHGALIYTDIHSFSVIGHDEIELRGSGEEYGTYRVQSLGGGGYQLHVINDAAQQGNMRAIILVTGPWVRQH